MQNIENQNFSAEFSYIVMLYYLAAYNLSENSQEFVCDLGYNFNVHVVVNHSISSKHFQEINTRISYDYNCLWTVTTLV